MKHGKIIVTLGLILGVAGILVWQNTARAPEVAGEEYQRGSYRAPDGEFFKLDGKNIVYFGNEVRSDFNHDGYEDAAFLFTVNPGGSGTFYYLAVALLSPGGYTGTNAILLGDRISPQSTEMIDGNIIVNYADRKIDEPMTTAPTVGVSREFHIENTTLVENSPKTQE